MSSNGFSHRQKAVIENAKWVDGVLLTGVTIAGTATIAKLIGTSEIDLLGLKLSLKNIWVVFAALTIAHFYTGWLLNRSIYRLWKIHSDEKCLTVFQEVITTGWVFVRDLSPRTKIVKTIFGIRMYEMRLDDPSTWATHVFALILMAAIIPFDYSNQRVFWGMVLVAIAITIINWTIGSFWLVSLSELAIPHKESIYLISKKATEERKPVQVEVESRKFNFAPAFKGIIPVFGAVVTIAASLLALIGISSLGAVYAYLNSLGWGNFFLKSLFAFGGLLLAPILLKRLLKIKRLGKPLFVVSNLVLGGLIIAGYWVWIS
jgi:hypothetical protein